MMSHTPELTMLLQCSTQLKSWLIDRVLPTHKVFKTPTSESNWNAAVAQLCAGWECLGGPAGNTSRRFISRCHFKHKNVLLMTHFTTTTPPLKGRMGIAWCCYFPRVRRR